MPFLMLCPNKGCGSQMEPYLELTDNKEISNVTHFVKMQMKSLKQFRKKKNLSFSVKCQKCNKEDRPKIVNKEVACPSCNTIHSHLSEPFKIMLKEQLKTANQDV